MNVKQFQSAAASSAKLLLNQNKSSPRTLSSLVKLQASADPGGPALAPPAPLYSHFIPPSALDNGSSGEFPGIPDKACRIRRLNQLPWLRLTVKRSPCKPATVYL